MTRPLIGILFTALVAATYSCAAKDMAEPMASSTAPAAAKAAALEAEQAGGEADNGGGVGSNGGGSLTSSPFGGGENRKDRRRRKGDVIRLPVM